MTGDCFPRLLITYNKHQSIKKENYEMKSLDFCFFLQLRLTKKNVNTKQHHLNYKPGV